MTVWYFRTSKSLVIIPRQEFQVWPMSTFKSAFFLNHSGQKLKKGLISFLKYFSWFLATFSNYFLATLLKNKNSMEFDAWKCDFFFNYGTLECEFCEKWNFEDVNFVKNDTFKMWILWKNETLKMWILWKVIVLKCEFLDK